MRKKDHFAALKQVRELFVDQIFVVMRALVMDCHTFATALEFTDFTLEYFVFDVVNFGPNSFIAKPTLVDDQSHFSIRQEWTK